MKIFKVIGKIDDIYTFRYDFDANIEKIVQLKIINNKLYHRYDNNSNFSISNSSTKSVIPEIMKLCIEYDRKIKLEKLLS